MKDLTFLLNVNSSLFISFIWIFFWGILWDKKGWLNMSIKVTFFFLGLYGLLVWLYNMGYIISIK
jgi:hypothetical protein